MSALFFKKLREKISLTTQEEEIIRRYIISKKIRKKQYLLQAGDVCKALAFVEQGALRAYSVDDKGQEHIIRFAMEGWTISDLDSFMTSEPSIYNIDALEDTEIIFIPKSAWEEVKKVVPQYELFIRLELMAAYSDMQKRITALISLTPEETYTYFVSVYPCIVQRVPQHMIASYLGLTPETLSRVRKRLFTGK
ncbi:Crp/Fnr family transcriptional regulator [Chitinophaga agrisoli]|uniref:Crp/Fnr family transcriptional regulator n=1 Tax=Chitinophaga agrisoli TaxID=2607653 RepID=A0A5B2VUI1_9BACT|nr:Crp/Fnr family transcriptional regulator [Chitinophaga agrisoli]KAA2242725.1 Crp/Fnr family transcriptional regulator [Chitinophaga agrisoli]